MYALPQPRIWSHTQITTSKNYPAFLLGLMALLLTVGASNAFGQIDPGKIYLGALDNSNLGDFPLPSLFVRAPDNRLDCHGLSGATSDQYHFRANVATINRRAIERATSTPLFATDFFGNGSELINPGHRYRDISYPTAPFQSATGLHQTGSQSTPIVPPTNSRFVSGGFNIQNQSVSAHVSDSKVDQFGASTIVLSWSETYVQTLQSTTPFPISFGGAFGVDISLPIDMLFPGAAAASLSTHLAVNGNLLGPNGNIVSDLGCFEVGTLMGAVSEGITDGTDNNLGPQENFFGNADVGAFVPGVSTPITSIGKVKMNRTTSGSNALHTIRGTWETDPFTMVPAASGDAPILTVYNTLTLIADPGAKVSLAPFSAEDLLGLPHDFDFLTVATGTVVPEPTTMSLAGLGLMALGCTVRKRR